MESRTSPARGFDFTLVFAVTIVLFIALSMIQFSNSWGDAQRGLLIFEKACPLSHSAPEPARKHEASLP
jgi:hypothetical protein